MGPRYARKRAGQEKGGMEKREYRKKGRRNKKWMGQIRRKGQKRVEWDKGWMGQREDGTKQEYLIKKDTP